jgi:hypothetical protein
MDFKINGTITAIDEKSGQTKDGNEWRKVVFAVTNNDGYEGRENVYAFSKMGDEHVDNFIKYNKVGDLVDVQFSISSREYNGNYYTDLRAFRVDKVEAGKPQKATPQPKDDLPF